MSYYQAGDYYQGDYYQGDFLGIGKAIKKVGGALLGGVSGFISGGPLGAVKSAVASLKPKINAPALVFGGGGGPEPGITGIVHRALPGGHSGYLPRRRMNPTNVKALRRAGRRVKGFLKIASRLGALPVNRGKGKRLFKRKAR